MASPHRVQNDLDYSDSAGPVLSALVEEQLQQERRLKDSLEQRGITVITSAGVLVALLLGFAGIAGTAALSAMSVNARTWIGSALALFALSAVLGLSTNMVLRYTEAKASTLKKHLTEEWWTYPAADAAREVANLRADSVESARSRNTIKAKLLAGAILAEAVAIVCLAVGAGIILHVFGLQ